MLKWDLGGSQKICDQTSKKGGPKTTPGPWKWALWLMCFYIKTVFSGNLFFLEKMWFVEKVNKPTIKFMILGGQSRQKLQKLIQTGLQIDKKASKNQCRKNNLKNVENDLPDWPRLVQILSNTGTPSRVQMIQWELLLYYYHIFMNELRTTKVALRHHENL